MIAGTCSAIQRVERGLPFTLALILSHHHNRNLRTLRGPRSFGESALVVAQHATAFYGNNLGFRTGFGLDPFQNTDDMLQDLMGRIVPEFVHKIFRVRTNDCDGFRVLFQREKVSIIF
jgi:hypothetical protein